MELDEKTRYQLFRKTEGKCAHCHRRLHWDEFDVRGRSGGWVLEIDESGEDEVNGKAFCFRCAEFPDRKKYGRLYTRAGLAVLNAEGEEEDEDEAGDDEGDDEE